jgi:hypothetical protein
MLFLVVRNGGPSSSIGGSTSNCFHVPELCTFSTFQLFQNLMPCSTNRTSLFFAACCSSTVPVFSGMVPKAHIVYNARIPNAPRNKFLNIVIASFPHFKLLMRLLLTFFIFITRYVFHMPST